jgi:hypothetical protein
MVFEGLLNFFPSRPTCLPQAGFPTLRDKKILAQSRKDAKVSIDKIASRLCE